MAGHVIRDRIWESKRLRRCSRDAALAYPWIFLVADDWGRFEYDPRRIWSKVFGNRRDISEEEVTSWLDEYEREGLLVRYNTDGELAHWYKFQGRPESQRRESTYPEPTDALAFPYSRTEQNRSDQNGSDRREKAADAARAGSSALAVESREGQIRQVFDHWRLVCGHEDAKLTPKRERRVRERLREGFTVEQLRRAVDGCRNSPFHMGANDRATKYDDLELICRDGEHVEKFLTEQPNGHRPPARAAPGRQSVGEKTLGALERAIARHGGGLDRDTRLREGAEQAGNLLPAKPR